MEQEWHNPNSSFGCARKSKPATSDEIGAIAKRQVGTSDGKNCDATQEGAHSLFDTFLSIGHTYDMTTNIL